MYISYKFGELLSSTCAVIAAQLCTADIDQHSASMFTREQHVCVLLLLIRGNTAMVGGFGLYTGLCHICSVNLFFM